MRCTYNYDSQIFINSFRKKWLQFSREDDFTLNLKLARNFIASQFSNHTTQKRGWDSREKIDSYTLFSPNNKSIISDYLKANISNVQKANRKSRLKSSLGVRTLLPLSKRKSLCTNRMFYQTKFSKEKKWQPHFYSLLIIIKYHDINELWVWVYIS